MAHFGIEIEFVELVFAAEWRSAAFGAADDGFLFLEYCAIPLLDQHADSSGDEE